MTSSQQHSPNEGIDLLDDATTVFYLEVPKSEVVLLQAYFEHYEGLGIVRTLAIERGLVCIITTPDMMADCLSALDSIKEKIRWRWAPIPEESDRKRYLGYFKKTYDSNNSKV